MSYSPQTYTGNGSTTTFSIPFTFINSTDVKATVGGTAVATSDYSIDVPNSNFIFNTAPANSAVIKIFRDTNNANIEANLQSGSTLRAVDFNDNFQQLLFVTQESTDLADTAVADSESAKTSAEAAVATSNTANTNSTNAVNTANTASTNASAAVTTANTADTNATAALNNSRESDGSGGFTSAIDKANTAITTANAANTAAAGAVTDSAAAVTTANAASTSAANAVNTANTASTNATTALNTANAADTTANTALTNSRESDGSGGFTSAISKANTAISTANTASTNASTALSTANTASTNASNAVTTANAASTAVSNAAFYGPIANVAAIPGSPANEDRIEILDSTGIQSFSPLTGLPSGFTGSSDLTVRLQYSSSGSTWEFKQYFAEDPEARYATVASVNTKMPLAGGTFSGLVEFNGNVTFDDLVIIKGDSTNGSGKISLNCENNSHAVHIKGPPHSANASYTLVLPNSLRSTTTTIGTITDTAADIPTGTTAQRPSSPAAGQFRFNSTDSKFEGYDGSDWGEIGGGGAAIIDGGDFNSASSIAGASTQTFDGGEFT